jgi:Tfp pilus assembly protein FimV
MLAATGVVVMLAGSAAQAGGSDAPEHRTPGPAVRTYVVHPGDTLWGIASRLVGSEGDPRPVMDELAQVNGIDGGLAVGTRLTLPA